MNSEGMHWKAKLTHGRRLAVPRVSWNLCRTGAACSWFVNVKKEDAFEDEVIKETKITLGPTPGIDYARGQSFRQAAIWRPLARRAPHKLAGGLANALSVDLALSLRLGRLGSVADWCWGVPLAPEA